MSVPKFCVKNERHPERLRVEAKCSHKTLVFDTFEARVTLKSGIEILSVVALWLALLSGLSMLVSVFSSSSVAYLFLSWLSGIFVCVLIFVLVFLSWFCSGTSKMLVWGC